MNPNPSQTVQAPHGLPPAPVDGRVATTPTKSGNLQRLPTVEDRTSLKKSSIYAGVKAGTFPAPVRLSARAVAWRDEDISRWINERTTAAGGAK